MRIVEARLCARFVVTVVDTDAIRSAIVVGTARLGVVIVATVIAVIAVIAIVAVATVIVRWELVGFATVVDACSRAFAIGVGPALRSVDATVIGPAVLLIVAVVDAVFVPVAPDIAIWGAVFGLDEFDAVVANYIGFCVAIVGVEPARRQERKGK